MTQRQERCPQCQAYYGWNDPGPAPPCPRCGWAAGRRPAAEALAEARELRALLAGSWRAWEIAGSLRRGRPWIADVDHVVIPAWGERPTEGALFGAATNLLWYEIDRLAESGRLEPATYPAAEGRSPHRWGQLMRGVSYKGHRHEIWTTTAEAWGSALAIRTGPAGYSRDLVTRLRARGYAQEDGRVIRLDTGSVIPTPTEADYFRLAGVGELPPAKRTAP